MLSGTRGAKYGLQLPGKKGVDAKAAKAKGVVSKKPAIFAEESDEENVEAEIARQAAKKRSDKELEQQHAAALAEDPNVFDYDGVYDQMKEAKAKPAQQQQAQRQPRYIEALLKKAKERERTQEMVMERKIHKEQEAEAHLYGDTEKFVTGAYKRKLAEDAKWREEERRREKMEKANDVSTKGDLSDFYRNLLNKNEAFGGGARAVVAPPVNPSSKDAAASPKKDSESRKELSTGISEPENSRTERVAQRQPVERGDPDGKVEDLLSREERTSDGEVLESIDEEREDRRAGSDGGVRNSQSGHAAGSGRSKPADTDSAGGRVGGSDHVAASVRPKAEDAIQSGGDAGGGNEAVKKTDAVADAKARYLARKKQRT